MSILDDVERANNGINKALFFIFNFVRLTSVIGRVAIIFFVIYSGNLGFLSAADVAGLLALFVVFESFLFDSVEFYKNFTKDFSDIEKIWEMFDNAPEIH